MLSEKVLSNTHPSWFSKCKDTLRNLDRNLLLLIATPLLLICFNEIWLFSYSLRGYIDPWIYFGFFLDLKEHLNTFNNTYYGTRLPWILPGFLAHQLFPSLLATYVLHLAFYYAAIISLYLILKRLIHPYVALLAAMLLGYHHFFLEAVGNNYIDGAALTYFLLTLLMFTPGSNEQNGRIKLCLAGVFYACMIYTQLFLIVYTPFVILYYFFIYRIQKPLPLKIQSLWFVNGILGLTLFFCSFNYSINGIFFFFMPIFDWTVDFVKRANPWWYPLSHWLKAALWLLLPLITFVGSVLTLIFHRNFRALSNYRFILFFQVFYILHALLHVFIQLVSKQPVLHYSYYASYLMPALFFALGAQFTIVISKMNKKHFYYLFFTIAVLFCLFYKINFHKTASMLSTPMSLSFLFGVGGLIWMIIWPNTSKWIGIALVAISLIAINIYSDPRQVILPTQHETKFQKQALLTVIEAIRAVQKMDPQGKAFYWYNGQVPLNCVYRSVSSAYLWGYRLINENFPSTKPLNGCNRVPVLSQRIFIISPVEQNVIEESNQNLAPIGFKGKLLNEMIVQQGQVDYKLTFIEICSLEDPSKI